MTMSGRYFSIRMCKIVRFTFCCASCTWSVAGAGSVSSFLRLALDLFYAFLFLSSASCYIPLVSIPILLFYYFYDVFLCVLRETLI
jgi:hypothetical protein